MSSIDVNIDKNEEDDTFDLTIKMKRFNGNYFLSIEHVFDKYIQYNQTGVLAQQKGFCDLTTEPIIELRNLLLQQVNKKLDDKWKS